MKAKLFSLLFTILFIGSVNAQNWKWAKTACYASGASISNDGISNSYVTGSFSGTSAVFGTYTLSAVGVENFFIAKYDSLGNYIWANTIGITPSNHSSGLSIKSDLVGNSYVLGNFQGGFMTIGSYTLTSGNAFLAKYDPNGNVLWAVSIVTTTGTYNGTKISIDALGNSYLAGRFSDNNDYTILIKYDNLGNLVWKKYAIGSGVSPTNWQASSISIDSNGNMYLAGTFGSSSLSFDGNAINNASAGYLLYVVKYDNAGNVKWAKSTGTYGSLYRPSITCDANGNSYVTGFFNGNYAAFNGTILTNSTMQEEIFIVKFDSLGNQIWAKQGIGASAEEPYDITCDANGNIYSTGMFWNSTVFGTQPVYSNGYYDPYIVKHDPNGNAIWAKNAGGSGGDIGRGISADNYGNIYVTGFFAGVKGYFGSTTLWSCDSISYPGGLYVAKLGSGNLQGIYELESNSASLIFYPNPSLNETWFKTDKLLNKANLIIYDAIGQEVRTVNNISGHEFKLQREDLPSGIYFVRLTENNVVIKSGKLVLGD